jgi:predicted nucleic acid-binding protein
LIGGFNPKDAYHKPAAKILTDIERRKRGDHVITDYIFDEVLTFIRRRLGFERSIQALESVLASEALVIEKVGLREFEAGIIIFEKYPKLSFTDASSLAFMSSKGITKIYSFDAGFDGYPGIVRVTSPSK